MQNQQLIRDLRKQSMKIRHPAFTGTLDVNQKVTVNDTAGLLNLAAQAIEHLELKGETIG